MGNTIKKNVAIAIKEEVTEGTYVAPAAGADFIQTTNDGNELSPAKELLSRDILTGSIEAASPRHGLQSVSGSLAVELKAHGTAGTAPEYGILMESLLQGTRSSVAITSGTTHTTSLLNVASTSNLAVGDIVVVKETGAYHISPIASIVADTSITLLIAADSAFSDSVVIEAVKSYYSSSTGGKSFSVSKYLDSVVLEKAAGCRVSSMAVSNFAAGQLASLEFGFEGMSFDRSVSSNAITPAYDVALPPVILNACVYVNGAVRAVSEVSLSVENTLAWITSTCSSTGRQGSKLTSRSISGSFSPFKEDDNVTMFDLFKNETEFSLFFYAYIPSSTAGEYSDSVAFYLPKCKVSEIADADQDGILQDSISFVATTGEATNSTSLTVSYS